MQRCALDHMGQKCHPLPQPVHITLRTTVHSLRATTATRLYQSGVDEQLVMERTGHRSIDGIRSYKRTSTQQQEALSDILNNRVPKISQPAQSAPQQHEDSSTQLEVVCSPNQEQNSTTRLVPACSQSTNIQTNTKSSLPGNFVFSSSTVTFNINY